MNEESQSVPDIIAKNLSILFCGINPGLMSAATHYHFAHPGNRFWKALHLSGLTPKLMKPAEQQKLLAFGIGITNFVARPSATAKEILSQEFIIGAQELEKKVIFYEPKVLAILGIEAYKKGFAKKNVKIGLQSQKIEKTSVWLLPNPSGLNGHYSLNHFATLFSHLSSTTSTPSTAAAPSTR